MDSKLRNKLAIQYVPLVKKISRQMYGKSALEFDEVECFGWEGFVYAMNTYDKNKSEMTFMAYAAYYIRNAILNGINRTSRSISVSYYFQKKAKESGEELPSQLKLSDFNNDGNNLSELGLEDEKLFDNPWELLVEAVKKNFSKSHADIFFSIYGLNGKKIEKGKDIAKRLNVSSSLITKKIKQVIKFIKNNKEISEQLRDLL